MDIQQPELSPSSIEISEEELLELQRMEAERAAALEAFAGEVEGKFSNCRGKRTHKEAEWIVARSMFLPDSPALGKSAEDFFDEKKQKRKKKFNIVRPKVSIAHSQLVSMQFGAGDKNWTLNNTARPQFDEGVDPEFARRAMENRISDQLEETDYGKETRKAMLDMLVLGTGILKGPSSCGSLRKVWVRKQTSEGNTIRVAENVPEYLPKLRRVDPWMAWVDPTASTIENADWVIETHPFSGMELTKLKANPKFFAEEIDAVLEDEPKDWFFSTISDEVNTTNYDAFKNKYVVMEYNGVASVDCACAIRPEISKNGKTVFVQAFVVNNRVIYFDTFDLDTVDSVPYAFCSWEEDPSSVYGFGIPITMVVQQSVVDGIYDVMVENAKLSSGPQLLVNISAVEPSEDGKYELEPWKIWTTNDYNADVNKIFQQFTPESRQQELGAILQMARDFADEESGIPLIQGGLESSEIATSATGTAMQHKAASSVLTLKSQQWDDGITKKAIRWMYDWNMQYGEDDSEKGDFEIDVVTPTAYIRKNMEIQNLEKLSVEAAQNPALAAELNISELARARVAGMMLPADNILKTPEQKQLEAEQAGQQPDPAMLELEIKQQEVAVAQEKVALEKQRLEWESTRGQQRDYWEHQERMANTIARREENQASLLGKQAEKETELIKLAASQDIKMAELEAKYNIASMNDETKIALESMNLDLRGRAQRAKELELEYATRTGKGI